MDTVSCPYGMDPNKMLTERQQVLLRIIERHKRNGTPLVQRDLAEALGIRRESVNKLLQRLRRRLEKHGQVLAMPDRCGRVTASIGTLMDGALV